MLKNFVSWMNMKDNGCAYEIPIKPSIMKLLRLNQLILAAGALLICATGTIQAAVIASANFTGLHSSGATSVAISGTPGVNGFTWSQFPFTTTTYSTPSVNMQTGTANALSADLTNGFQGMIGTMPSSTTIAIGETLTFSFIGQFTQTPGNTANALRFGFVNSGSPDNAFGMRAGTGTEKGISIVRDVSTGGNGSPLGGAEVVQITSGTGTQNIITNSVYSASFSITRTATDTYDYLGNIDGSTVSATGVVGGFNNYNAIAILSTPNADFRIDNVSVALIPEPSALLLSGLGVILLLRRRR